MIPKDRLSELPDWLGIRWSVPKGKFLTPFFWLKHLKHRMHDAWDIRNDCFSGVLLVRRIVRTMHWKWLPFRRLGWKDRVQTCCQRSPFGQPKLEKEDMFIRQQSEPVRQSSLAYLGKLADHKWLHPQHSGFPTNVECPTKWV